jgi:hypothetical protein
VNVCGVALVAAAHARPADVDPRLAERALLTRLLTESGVSPSPSPPAWADYLSVLAKAFAARLGPRLQSLAELVGAQGSWIGTAALVVALLLLATVAILIVLGALRRRRIPGELPRMEAVRSYASPADPPPAPDTLRAEMEKQVDAGDLRGALASLWWWVARSLCGAEARPWWTTRDLVDRAGGRPGLRPAMLRFDRLAYGGGPPTPSALRELLRDLEGMIL